MVPNVKALYNVSEEEVKAVRKLYGKNNESITQELRILKEWMNKQNHFPSDYDDGRIEKFLLRNKFRIEHTKIKLENYYTARGENLELLKKLDPTAEVMQMAFKTTLLTPLPKLTKPLERVYVQRVTKRDLDYTLEGNFLMGIAFMELELTCEYSAGLRLIIDLTNLTFNHLKSLDIGELSRGFYLLEECFSSRICGIEIMNASPALNAMMELMKLALPAKLYKKFRVHNSVESLEKVVPKENLPSDYGGELKSMEEYFENTKKCLIENRDYLLTRKYVVSDESKRIGPVKKNELFGIDGTFKKINID